MEERFSGPTEIEISFDHSYKISAESSGTCGLWSTTSCSNFLTDLDDLYNGSGEGNDVNFLQNSPQVQFLSSDYEQNDLVASLLPKNSTEQGESMNKVVEINGGREGRHGERSSTFVKWNGIMTSFNPSLRTQKSQSLHKRCIRFLKCINDHRISPLDETHGHGKHVNKHGDIYDKLAIHHVIAERKRRQDMKHIFSNLGLLLPINPKKGRAPVLLQTIDYITHLKERVDQLERRNGELEALLHEKSHHS